MFLMTHSATGMLIGVVAPYPPLAFSAGVVSHALLDIIPHEHKDDLITTYPKDSKESGGALKRKIIVSVFDLACTLGIIVFCWKIGRSMPERPEILIGMLSGIAGGLFPDCLNMLSFFTDNRFQRWYFDLHNKIHFVLSRVSVPRTVAIGYQVLLSCLFLRIAYTLLY